MEFLETVWSCRARKILDVNILFADSLKGDFYIKRGII